VRRRYPTNRPVAVESSAIEAVTYDPKMSSLDVRFKRGTSYRYGCVSPETYKAFLDADSKGRFFVSKIRNAHPFMREIANAS
jgi:hypothetical protein